MWQGRRSIVNFKQVNAPPPPPPPPPNKIKCGKVEDL